MTANISTEHYDALKKFMRETLEPFERVQLVGQLASARHAHTRMIWAIVSTMVSAILALILGAAVGGSALGFVIYFAIFFVIFMVLCFSLISRHKGHSAGEYLIVTTSRIMHIKMKPDVQIEFTVGREQMKRLAKDAKGVTIEVQDMSWFVHPIAAKQISQRDSTETSN